MKSRGMNDQKIIVSMTIILILILMVLGLDAIFIHGRKYHEDTTFIKSNSDMVLKERLQRGDRVNIKVETLEERPVELLVNGGSLDYCVQGSRMNFTTSIPSSTHYSFVLNNLGDNRLLVSYDYEVILMHSFWSGIVMVVSSLIIIVAMIFHFREEASKKSKSVLKNIWK